MSRFWKPSRNNKNDFEEYYYKYKSGQITMTEFAYFQNLSVMGVYKRIKYFEKNNSCKYNEITEIEKRKTLKLMNKYICEIKKFKIEYQDKLTDVLYRTCLYIVRNQDEIKNEKNLVWFSLRRKVKDIKYEEYHKKENLNLDRVLCLEKFGVNN